MVSKWAGIVNKLPKLELADVDPERAAIVEAFKTAILEQFAANNDGKKPSATDLVRLYRERRVAKDSLKDELSELQVEIDAYEELLKKQFEAEGAQTIKLEDGCSVAVQSEPTAKITNKEQLRLWCIANGYVNEMVLPYPTVNSLVKTRLSDGLPEPPGVEAKAWDNVVLRGAKPKAPKS